MYIEWKKEYCIGVQRIDEQHQKLISLLNQLYTLVGQETNSEQNNDKSWRLLGEFNQYAETHFNTEERIAADNNVPFSELESHKGEHQAYRERIKLFQKNYLSSAKFIPVQLMAFLSKWWLSHILVKDMELGKWINQNTSEE